MDKPKIFIVDDEEDVRAKLKSYLSRHTECNVQEASNGREALKILEKEYFDLILLDIKMPGISGVDVLKKVKKIHPDTDVLVMTAYDSQQVAAETLKEGATDYIPKPSTIEAIHTKIYEVLKKKNKYLPKEPKSKTY